MPMIVVAAIFVVRLFEGLYHDHHLAAIFAITMNVADGAVRPREYLKFPVHSDQTARCD
jgi:hypothetical protein